MSTFILSYIFLVKDDVACQWYAVIVVGIRHLNAHYDLWTSAQLNSLICGRNSTLLLIVGYVQYSFVIPGTSGTPGTIVDRTVREC